MSVKWLIPSEINATSVQECQMTNTFCNRCNNREWVSSNQMINAFVCNKSNALEQWHFWRHRHGEGWRDTLHCCTVTHGLSVMMFYLRATRRQPAVKSFFPQSYGTLKQRDISENIDFSDNIYWATMFYFHHIVDPARPNPALTVFYWLFLNQFRRYKLEISSWLGCCVLNFRIKFGNKNFHWFRNCSVSHEAGLFYIFS